MKKILLFVGLLIVFSPAYCPLLPQELKGVYTTEWGQPKKINYEIIFKAVCYIESNGLWNSINLKEKAIGIAQIRQIRLKDYYNQTGIYYRLTEMYDINKSKKVFMYYATKYPPEEYERICREWNGGPNGMKKYCTKKYFKKIEPILKSYLTDNKSVKI